MKTVAKIIFIFAVMISTNITAQAKPNHKYKHPDAYRYVKAVSQFDLNSYVIVPVRHGKFGDQVLVPKHGWADCEYTCEFTVQKNYLDFWENQTDDDLSPGHLFGLRKYF